MHAQKNSISWSSLRNDPSTTGRSGSDASYSGTWTGSSWERQLNCVCLFGDSSTSDSLPDELASQCGDSVSSPDLQPNAADMLNQQILCVNGSVRYGPVTLGTLRLMTDMYTSNVDKRYRQYKASFQKLFNEAIRVHQQIQMILIR